MPDSCIILGLDPGLQHTGWGVIRCLGSSLELVDCGTVHPPVKAPLPQRLLHLHRDIDYVMRQHRPHEVAIEKTFVSANGASTLKLGNARGALLLSLAMHERPISEYDPTKIKKSITGSGRADKQQIGHMVRLLLPRCPHDASEDAMDALAIAITHTQHRHMQRYSA